MKIEEYIDTEDSPNYVYTRVEIENGEKKFCDNIKNNEIFKVDYEKLRIARNKKKKNFRGDNCNTIALDTNNYMQMDIDIYDDAELKSLSTIAIQFLEWLDSKFISYKSTSKSKGKHYILPDFKDYDNSFFNALYNYDSNRISDYEKYKCQDKNYQYLNTDFGFIEILKGTWAWVKCDTDIHFPDDPFDMSRDLDKFMTIFNRRFLMKLDNDNNKINMSAPPMEFECDDKGNEFNEYLYNISYSIIDTLSGFYKLVGACICKGEDYVDTIRALGKESKLAKSNYDEWFDKLVDSIMKKSPNFSPYIVYTASKNSNIDNHFNIYAKYHYKEEQTKYTSKFLADIMITTNEDNLLVVKNGEDESKASEIYFYNTLYNGWINEKDNNGKIIKHFIGEDIEKYLENELKVHLQKPQPDKKEFPVEHKEYKTRTDDIKISLGKIQEPTLRNNIYEILEQRIKSTNAEYIEFDTNPDLLPFKNKVYNLKTNQLQDFNKEDLIMTKIQYDIREPDPIVRKQFYEFFNSLFASEKVKQDVKYILATTLLPIQIQKLFMFLGDGANGKSVLQNLNKAMLTNSFYVATSGNCLTKVIQQDKPSPEFAQVDNKRVVYFSEPSGSDELNQETCKMITGDEELSARKLYSSSMKVELKNTTITCLNKAPPISGVKNNATMRRFIQIYFPFNFTNDKLKIENNPDKFKQGNKLYDNKKWKEEAKYAMLEMCLEFIRDYQNKYSHTGKDIYEDEYEFCDEVMKYTKDYLDDSNEVMNWVNSRIIYDEGECVVLTELYVVFTEDKIYKNMDKKIQKLYTKKSWIDNIEQQPEYSKHFIDNTSVKGVSKRKVLRNHRLRDEDEIEKYECGMNNNIEEIEENIIIKKDNDIIECGEMSVNGVIMKNPNCL
tara:strand:+ start:8 stop:2683 length:2676 start_codon:yes stop_codon:yes gene_type:complete